MSIPKKHSPKHSTYNKKPGLGGRLTIKQRRFVDAYIRNGGNGTGAVFDAGYETGEKDGFMQGFFHGTGHGLGLEIHEGPSIGQRGDVLKPGNIVTMEPGLYYRGLGGVRIEDTVLVCEDGYQNMSTLPKVLEV